MQPLLDTIYSLSGDVPQKQRERLLARFKAGELPYLVATDVVGRGIDVTRIREKLVVVIQSEMGRTPSYNAGKGKDHWSIGSIMFLGRGIRGNRVLGATDERQFHVPLHPQTLATDRQNGIRVRPEHIHTALRELAGVADHAFSRRFPLGVADINWQPARDRLAAGREQAGGGARLPGSEGAGQVEERRAERDPDQQLAQDRGLPQALEELSSKTQYPLAAG